MTTSALDICNKALSAASAEGQISALNEASLEAEICRQWYDLVVGTVQQASYWPGSRVVEYLPLLSTRDSSAAWERSDPDPEYTYKYGLPDAYLRAWYMSDYSRFSIGFDASTGVRVINSNSANAILVYARKQTDVNMWLEEQKMATIYGLAGHIGQQLTGKTSTVNRNFQLANSILLQAQASAADSSDDDNLDYVPSVIAARGYSKGSGARPYFYPHGPVFNVGT